jgi:hypothetical protein
MGVDLKLYLNTDAESDPDRPAYRRGPTGRAWDWLLYEGVGFARQGELWSGFAAAEKEHGETVPAAMYYGDEGLGERKTNPYGGPLTTLPIREVVRVLEAKESELYPKNRAILAYMRALHPDARVLLWWC